MLIGYMRVSTGDQTTALQEDALQKAGCEKVYRDVIVERKTNDLVFPFSWK